MPFQQTESVGTAKKANESLQNKRKNRIKFNLTELVSRVLYALRRGNHLSSLRVTAQFEPFGSATMKTIGGQPTLTGFKVLLRIGFTASLCCHKLG